MFWRSLRKSVFSILHDLSWSLQQTALNLKPMKDGSSGELRKLHDTLQHHLRSLKAMDQLDFERFMTALGECKLDDPTMVYWQKSIQAEKQVPGYDKLLEFLDLQATATELAPHETGPKKPHIPPGKSPKPPPTKPFLVYTANTKVKCTACNGSKHNLAYCQSFKHNHFLRSGTLLWNKDFVLTVWRRSTQVNNALH